MRYHNITKADMINGSGLRVVLWVAGCSHHCRGCQNSQTWDLCGGIEFDEDAKAEIFAELKNEWCSGITLSGGDPLMMENRESIAKLVLEIKQNFPNKNIWCYTGWIWEELMEQSNVDKDLCIILENIEFLCEGRFVLELRDVQKHYVGSKNQRIICVKESLERGKIVLYAED